MTNYRKCMQQEYKAQYAMTIYCNKLSFKDTMTTMLQSYIQDGSAKYTVTRTKKRLLDIGQITAFAL